MFENLTSFSISEPSTSTSEEAATTLDDAYLWVEETEDPNTPMKLVCLWAECFERLDSVCDLEAHLEKHLLEYTAIFSTG
jgi:hypothetical protein